MGDVEDTLETVVAGFWKLLAILYEKWGCCVELAVLRASCMACCCAAANCCCWWSRCCWWSACWSVAKEPGHHIPSSLPPHVPLCCCSDMTPHNSRSFYVFLTRQHSRIYLSNSQSHKNKRTSQNNTLVHILTNGHFRNKNQTIAHWDTHEIHTDTKARSQKFDPVLKNVLRATVAKIWQHGNEVKQENVNARRDANTNEHW